MANIERIWIDKEFKELRLDWDNDRHQAIKLDSLSSDDVITGIEQLFHLLDQENSRGDI